MFRSLSALVMLVPLSSLLAPSAALAWQRLEELRPPPEMTMGLEEEQVFNQAVAAMVNGELDDARRLLGPLAQAGIADAQVALGSLLSRSSTNSERKQALRWHYFAARRGVWHAQLAIGRAYRQGEILGRDLVESRSWLNQAVKKGGAEVLVELALLNRQALQAAKLSLEQAAIEPAIVLLEPVAESGSWEAQELLASVYQQQNNNERARHWYERAAEKGSRSAQYALAMSYLEEPDLDSTQQQKAIELLKQAADPGKAAAQYQLGMIYLKGQAVGKDEQKGIHWYRMAAEQGHAEAQYSLGVRYALGQGAEKNDYEAHRWFKKAAQQGYPKAKHNLAITYLHGIGTKKNPEQAHFWFEQANQDGVSKANSFVKTKNADNRIVANKQIAEPPIKRAKSKLPEKAVKPRKNNSKTKRYQPIHGWRWFSGLPNQGYTVQLIASQRPDSIQAFLKQLGIDNDEYLHYKVSTDKQQRHIVQYGYFKGYQAAKSVANKLSAGYTRFKPWIRDVKSVKNKLKNYQQS